MYDLVMFEKSVWGEKHTSNHFFYSPFDTISKPNSILYQCEKQLCNHIDIDLTGFDCAITPPNTVWKGSPVFHIGQRERTMEDIKSHFHINTDIPIYYFSKKIEDATNSTKFKCGYSYDTLSTIPHILKDRAYRAVDKFASNLTGVVFANEFSKHGDAFVNDLNIELMPIYTAWYSIKDILINHWNVNSATLDIYDNMFQDYQPSDFHWHFKIKLALGAPTIKFYRTLHSNPYV